MDCISKLSLRASPGNSENRSNHIRMSTFMGRLLVFNYNRSLILVSSNF